MSDDAPDTSTRFQLGNDAWKARSSHGRTPIFADPEALIEACTEYFAWVSENPLIVMEPVKFQGRGTLMEVPKMRAMTIVGLTNFLGMSARSWRDYRDRPVFADAVERVEAVIYQQKLEGAAADMLNSSIIARELGLLDRSEVTTKAGSITHIESEYVDP